jgi:hypothetical protein
MGSMVKPLPITNKKAKLSIIHIAKKELGLTDELYRVLLYGAASINSAKELQFEYQFESVMKAFENLGFKSARRKKNRPARSDKWRCTEAQRAKIEIMWKRCARNPTEMALRVFVHRITHVDNPAWMDVKSAQKVIFALEAMAKNAKRNE